MCRKSRDSPMGEVNGMGKFSIGVVKKFDNDAVVQAIMFAYLTC